MSMLFEMLVGGNCYGIGWRCRLVISVVVCGLWLVTLMPFVRKKRGGVGGQLIGWRTFLGSINLLMIDDYCLIDLSLCGRRYTWYRVDVDWYGSSMSRLDRFLLFEDWIGVWPNCVRWLLLGLFLIIV